MAKKKYEVVGPFVTLETAPGGTFERELDPVMEQRLLEQGAIREVKAAKAATKDDSSKEG